jgi:hypothetical protein
LAQFEQFDAERFDLAEDAEQGEWRQPLRGRAHR